MEQSTPTSVKMASKVSEWESVRKTPIDKERIIMYRTTHDMILLDQITLDSVLECLVERFRSREYHTFAGSVLVSLNPCLKTSRNTFEDIQAILQYEDISNAVIRSPPHVYSVGQQCLKNLLTSGNHQIIVVSGDSGAGKTTATQQLIKYFIERNSRLVEVKTPNNLDKKIYFATLILESLGNASTIANHNSSRFGRLVQLTLDTQTSSIIGAKIRTCLLEKQRVPKCSSNERNFHIFYHFIVALKSGSFHLEDFADNVDPVRSDLIPQHFKDSVTPADEEDFRSLYQSLQCLNLHTELENIFRIIFGIMVLLNVQFVPLEDDGYIEYEEVPNNFNGGNCGNTKEFGISDAGMVETLGNVFGIDGEELVQSLIARKIMAGGARRKSIFFKRCETVQECQDRLSAMTSALYDALFNHVLLRLNRMLSCKKESKANSDHWGDYLNTNSVESIRKLSLLDLYGFENFENKNHLEQLCINYANERLQHVHISKMKSYFEEMHEIENGMEEPLELMRVESEILERIDDIELNVFSILNEECLLNRGSQMKAVFDRMSLVTKTSKYIQASKFETEDYPFVVKHYASDVQYHLEGMVTKNADNIPPEFYEVFGGSDNYFIKLLISLSKISADESTNNKLSGKNLNSKKKGRTILQRFKTSVDELVNELVTDENHDVHFIRCIRPNSELTEGKIQLDVVKRQLFSSGIVDIIRIAGNGYPIRIHKDKFIQQFSSLLRRHCQDDLNENVLKELLPFNNSELKFGKSLVFFTEKSWKFLKGMERCVTIGYIIKIQRVWRKCLESKQFAERQQKSIMENEFVESLSTEEECFYSPRAGPFGDIAEDSGEKLEVKKNEQLSETAPKLYSFENVQKLLWARKSYESMKWNFNKMCDMPIYIGDRIVSRSQIYEPPIKFFTRKTTLVNSHIVPLRLKPKGLMDALSYDEINERSY